MGCEKKSESASDISLNPMPKEHVVLRLSLELNVKDLEDFRNPTQPADMDDKWVLVYQDDQLNFHRSWTGNMIYSCTVISARDNLMVSECLANRNASQVKLIQQEQMAVRDERMIIELISMLMGRKL